MLKKKKLKKIPEENVSIILKMFLYLSESEQCNKLVSPTFIEVHDHEQFLSGPNISSYKTKRPRTMGTYYSEIEVLKHMRCQSVLKHLIKCMSHIYVFFKHLCDCFMENCPVYPQKFYTLIEDTYRGNNTGSTSREIFVIRQVFAICNGNVNSRNKLSTEIYFNLMSKISRNVDRALLFG